MGCFGYRFVDVKIATDRKYSVQYRASVQLVLEIVNVKLICLIFVTVSSVCVVTIVLQGRKKSGAMALGGDSSWSRVRSLANANTSGYTIFLV